jgi:hypothetical protein
MSRSYKHTPYAGDRKTKWAKRQANRKYRSFLKQMEEDVPYSHFKKVSESWNICDYYSIFTLHGWMRDKWNLRRWEREKITEREKIQEWYKWYKRK